MYRQSETCISPICPHNMVNFSPLTAEIGLGVSGTPANFNGFRVLAALLHGTLVAGINQTLRRWTEGATYIRQAAITLGIGPHSSSIFVYNYLTYCIFQATGILPFLYHLPH